MAILNKYKRWNPLFVPLLDRYFDFVLTQDNAPSVPINGTMRTECLLSYIDANEDDCQEDMGLCSLPQYGWPSAVCENIVCDNIGLTGVDNGLISFDKDKVTNKDLLDILTGTKFTITDDNRLHLNFVTGNTSQFSYGYEIIQNENKRFVALKGGFLQGFFKLYEKDYQILPQYIEDEWNMEFVIRPKDYEIESNILNTVHPENAGIFFYMGTRAENKFILLYGCDLSSYENRYTDVKSTCENFYTTNYIGKELISAKPVITKKQPFHFGPHFFNEYGYDDTNNCTGIEKPSEGGDEEGICKTYVSGDTLVIENSNIDDIYIQDRTLFFNEPVCCVYMKNGTLFINNGDTESEDCLDNSYFADDFPITKDIIITDSEGNLLTDTLENTFRVVTDNKFLTFDRTCDGFTVNKSNKDSLVEFIGQKIPNDVNLFLLMNRTKTGYTVDNINEYITNNTKPSCHINEDIKNNAFALKLNDDGSIGYRYITEDCDSETKWSVLEEYSFPDIVAKDKWNVIAVKFKILDGATDNCGVPIGKRKMKIYIYVNGYLKFISKELTEFNFKELKETANKQEGVPFNISIGGGSQGLSEMIWTEYCDIFNKVLPIEKYFAGTFIGDFRSFKFYGCQLQYNDLKNNYINANNAN